VQRDAFRCAVGCLRRNGLTGIESDDDGWARLSLREGWGTRRNGRIAVGAASYWRNERQPKRTGANRAQDNGEAKQTG
jgi:hypothetical protein